MESNTKILTTYDKMFLSRMQKLTSCQVDTKIYGLNIFDLSTRQRSLAYNFAKDLEPWLLKNVGQFNQDWFVELDNDVDSLRLIFKDNAVETYFTLAWMYGERLSYSDDKS